MQSLAKQSYRDIELIIVNDGSTDNSEELILSATKNILPSNIKVKYIFQENKGIGGAINTALKEITGEFFVWFNIDDILTENCIKLMAEFLEGKQEYALVRPNVYIVDEQNVENVLGLINDKNPDADKEDLFENVIQGKHFTFGCSMLRTEVFDEVNPQREIYESRQGQNWQLLLPVLYGHKSGYISTPLYSVVEQQESTSRVSSYSKRIKQLKEYEDIVLTTISQMSIPNEKKLYYLSTVRARYSHTFFSLAIMNGDFLTVKTEYSYLKNNKILYEIEKKQYRKRFFKIEYWLYLKNNLLKK